MNTSPAKDSLLDDTRARVLATVAALADETHAGRRLAVELDSHLERDLGLDSLARAELLLRLQSALSVELPDSALSEALTPRDLLTLVMEAGGMTRAADLVAAPIAGHDASGWPDHATTLVEALEWHVARHPERTHVQLYGEGEQSEPLSYGALYAQARAVASGLTARGVASGHTVALMLPTGRDYLATFMAVMMLGAVPVPIYPPARPSQLEEHLRRHSRILANAGCVAMVTVAQAKPVAWLLRQEVPGMETVATPEDLSVPATPLAVKLSPEDTAFLQYTSGSTGDPKGVVLTHANLLANVRAMGQAVGVRPDDVFVSWLPLYHDMGLIGAWFCSLYYAMPLVLMSPLAFLARPVRWLRAVHRHRGTISAAPNFAYDLVARKLAESELTGLDLASWRYAFNGAEPVSPATVAAFAARLAPYGLRAGAIAPVYGLAECSVGLALAPAGRGALIDHIDARLMAEQRLAVSVAEDAPGAKAIVACGRVLLGHAIRIVDDKDRELAERQIGHVQFRGPSASRGYFRNDAATAALLHGDWRDTGDFGYLADGDIHITGRAKDLIIRGGRNLYPYELEQAVGALPGVRRGCVAVFAAADAASGSEQLVVLAETQARGADAQEALRARIQSVSVDVMGVPADAVVLAPAHSVLKTSSGKIRRAACREAYERGLIGQGAQAGWRVALRLGLATLSAGAATFWRRLPERIYASWAWVWFVLLGVPTWAMVALLRRPRIAHHIAHHVSRIFLLIIAVPFRPSLGGRLPARSHVLVVNHASYLDAVLLIAALPPRVGYAFVAKREFARGWMTRRFFEGIGALLVERFDAKRGIEDVDQVARLLAEGRSVVIFPEGTFTPQTGLRPFRMGAFVAAARAGVPIATAALSGVREMLRDKTWMPRHGHPRLALGAIIAPVGADWAEAVRLRDAARVEILRMSGEPDLDKH